MPSGIFTTTISKIIDMGVQETRHFKLDFEPGVDFVFEPGQFVNILLEKDGKTIKRPYSIDSPPHWKGFIDLCWKRVHLGKVTSELWGLKEGDRLKIQGPLGRFTPKKPLPGRVIFVSTGTGIAPFRAMIHTFLERNEPCEIWNIFGNRYVEDILYRDEFEFLAKKHPNLKNVFTVSRPKDWNGERDYVQHMLKKHITGTADTHIYICGLTSMINEVEKSALEMGFQKNQIFFEKYD